MHSLLNFSASCISKVNESHENHWECHLQPFSISLETFHLEVRLKMKYISLSLQLKASLLDILTKFSSNYSTIGCPNSLLVKDENINLVILFTNSIYILGKATRMKWLNEGKNRIIIFSWLNDWYIIHVFSNVLFRDTTTNLMVVMGALYTAALFLGVNNSSSVQPVISIERTVFYRERAAGMYSSFPYAAAQVGLFNRILFT